LRRKEKHMGLEAFEKLGASYDVALKASGLIEDHAETSLAAGGNTG
jgi:hypothetical protein